MPKPARITAERASAIAAKAHDDVLLVHVSHAIEQAAQQGLRHKTFWPERIGHQALPHHIITGLREDGFKVTHRDLGAIEVHWPEAHEAQ